MNVKTFQEWIQYKELRHLKAIRRGQARERCSAVRFVQWSSHTSYRATCSISSTGEGQSITFRRAFKTGSSEVTLCSQGNRVLLQYACSRLSSELSGPLLWTCQSFSKRLWLFFCLPQESQSWWASLSSTLRRQDAGFEAVLVRE